MRKTPCCEKNGLKRGPWTPEEDQKLIDYIQKNGYGNWRTLPKSAGLLRCGKSCRLRWTNYLRPDIKRGRFSLQEEETIIQLHSILGNKWSSIASRLPGRTDNEIKNYWNTHIRRRLLRMGIDPVTHKPRLDLLDLSTLLANPLSCLYNNSQSQIINNFPRMLGIEHNLINNPEFPKLITSFYSASDHHRQNPEFMVQNQLMSGPQIQDQVPDTTTTSCVPLCNLDGQYAEVYEQLRGSLTVDNTLTESYLCPATNYGYCGLNESENFTNFQCNERNHMSNFQYVLSNTSTPSLNSSPSTLCPSSTYASSSSEEERGSYCSTDHVLKFDISDRMLDVNCLM